MALTIYMATEELERNSKVTDTDLNELYQEVREMFPQYFVYEYHFTISKGFWKTEKITRYSIYNDIQNGEAQILMMPSQYTTKECVLSFFYGLINGAKFKGTTACTATKC